MKSKQVLFETVSKLVQYYYYKCVNNKMLQSDWFLITSFVIVIHGRTKFKIVKVTVCLAKYLKNSFFLS